MRSPLQLALILCFFSASLQTHAANEWKNPDLQQAPPQRSRPTAPPPTSPPAPAAATVKPAVAKPVPALKGQLGLDVIRVCDYRLSWADRGSGGKIDGAFYIPNVPNGYAMIGAYAQGNYHEPSDCVLAVKPADEQSISLLQVPASWERLWTDKGSGASADGSIWLPRAASSDYVCLGAVAQQGRSQPAISNYVCVHQCLVESVPGASRIWSTKGTGAKETAYVYKLHNSNSFYMYGNNQRPAELRDIKGDTRCLF